MIRRKLTLRRIDPWSVMKFGAAVNISMVIVGIFAFWILWAAISRLGLIEDFCNSVGILIDFGEECGLQSGTVFRWWLLLSGLGAVVMTGLMVLGAFLHNLVADLTGGLRFTVTDMTPGTLPERVGSGTGKIVGTTSPKDPSPTQAVEAAASRVDQTGTSAASSGSGESDGPPPRSTSSAGTPSSEAVPSPGDKKSAAAAERATEGVEAVSTASEPSGATIPGPRSARSDDASDRERATSSETSAASSPATQDDHRGAAESPIPGGSSSRTGSADAEELPGDTGSEAERAPSRDASASQEEARKSESELFDRLFD